ncbi:hypothetical protein CRG98_033283 [Punica granatum]|uniref:Uncharacterized protein n=1 Tax=Punica granatum TaxID=22663 RepID=A0A2I0IQN9_PUNGR|nr:hypothetical protein CRG98_033283 [Punica granatum]
MAVGPRKFGPGRGAAVGSGRKLDCWAARLFNPKKNKEIDPVRTRGRNREERKRFGAVVTGHGNFRLRGVPVVCWGGSRDWGLGSARVEEKPRRGIESGFEQRKTRTAASELGAPRELGAEKPELRDEHRGRVS